MSISINKKSFLGVLDVLSSIKEDSNPESEGIYLDFKKDQLILSRGNRTSKATAIFSIEYDGPASTVAVLFEDLIKMIKNCETSFLISLEKNGIKLHGNTYEYNIQSMKFGIDEVNKRKFEGKQLFTIHNSALSNFYSNLVVSPLKRNPEILDSLFINKEQVLSIDHPVISFMPFIPEIEMKNDQLLKPIPILLFEIANKLSPECLVDVISNGKQIGFTFKVSDNIFVSANCNYLDGVAPLDYVEDILKTLKINYTFKVNNNKLLSCLKRMKSLSGKDSSFVYMYVNDVVLTFTKELSEKCVSSAVSYESDNDVKELTIKFDVECVINALKNMEDYVYLEISNQFIVVHDSNVTHIFPYVQ